MVNKIEFSSHALSELDEIFIYLHENASEQAVDRFGNLVKKKPHSTAIQYGGRPTRAAAQNYPLRPYWKIPSDVLPKTWINNSHYPLF